MGSGLMVGGFDGWLGSSPAGGGGGGTGVTSWNGLTGDVKGTLAEIYAFGLIDGPTTDNLFAMADGHRRWADATSTSTSFATVSDAFWETPGATADRRVGPWLARRWVTAGEAEAAFRTDILYDASYVGNAIERSWVVDLAYLTNNLSETIVTGDQYAERKYSLHNFFNNQPFSQPSPGTATGAQSSESTFLFNGGGLGNFKTARTVTGWGQNHAFAQPQLAGVTPGFIAWYDPGTIADAIGNGTGFWTGWGTGSSFVPDHLTGGLSVTMLALDVNGSMQVSLWGRADHSTINKLVTWDNAVGQRLLNGGIQYPNVNSGTFPVSEANTGTIVWDQTAGKFKASVNGGAFVNLSTVS